MKEPEMVVVGSVYFDNFQFCKQGRIIAKKYLDIKRDHLEMMLRKGGKFNDSQHMILVEYKRLYENRVLWFWYVRFLLYAEVDRVAIHKWKCLDITNSYMLFTLIIQNKKQRKNYKRRESILNRDFADPFDYPQARNYLEDEFLRVRAKKES